MWLLDEQTLRALRESRALGIKPSETQLQAFEDRALVEARDGELPRNMKIAGAVAEVRIEGVLTKTPDFLAWLFGGGNTTYRSIISSLAIAGSDPSVRSVVLHIDSPGGNIDGLFDAIAALQAFKKPLSVKVDNALSAAYALAASGGRIEATSAASRVGSIGIVATALVNEDVVEITNTASPDKRPDVTTEEGKAVVRRHLDAVHSLFVEAIADGRTAARSRPVTTDEVTESYGRGGIILAGEAKKLGMIDSIAKPALRAVGGVMSPAAEAGGAQEGEQGPMDLKLLKASHPAVYEAAVQDGVNQERDRVTAHLTLGQSGGPEGMTLALSLVEKGEGMSMTAMAKYNSLAWNRSDRSARQQESDTVGAAADNALAPPPPAPASTTAPTTTATAPGASAQPAQQGDLGDQVVARLRDRGYGRASSTTNKETASAHR